MEWHAESRFGQLASPIPWRSWRLGGWFLVIEPPRRQGRQGDVLATTITEKLKSSKRRSLAIVARIMSVFSSMIVSHPAELARIKRKFVLAFGVFDGVHRGHQAILQQLRLLAAKHDALPAVFFFHPSPKAVLFPDQAPKMLYPLFEKQALFEEAGILHRVCLPFTRELAQLEPQEFLDQYLFSTGLALAGFCVGEDWRFGARNSGDAQLLKNIAGERGLEVRIVPVLEVNGAPVSSTRIRRAIQRGDFAEAALLLGRPWRICGKVTRGRGLAGTGLECPTANLEDPELLLPPWGIYAARASLQGQGKPLEGIIYIGDAPTVRKDDSPQVIVELHLFDFSGNLYDQEIRIEPVQFLRESRKFPNEEALKTQIHQDINQAREILT